MQKKTPRERRDIFTQNLRDLIGGNSISHICQEIGVNRSQFTRYLLGGTTPNPDVLSRICEFFQTDARILLTPLAEFGKSDKAKPTTPFGLLDEFLTDFETQLRTGLPDGYYQLWKWTYSWETKVQALFIKVFTENGVKQFRGYLPRNGYRVASTRPRGRMAILRGVYLAQDLGFQHFGHDVEKGAPIFSGTFEYQFRGVPGLNPGLLLSPQPYASAHRRVAASCMIPVAANTSAVLAAARMNRVMEHSQAPGDIRELLSELRDYFKVT